MIMMLEILLNEKSSINLPGYDDKRIFWNIGSIIMLVVFGGILSRTGSVANLK